MNLIEMLFPTSDVSILCGISFTKEKFQRKAYDSNTCWSRIVVGNTLQASIDFCFRRKNAIFNRECNLPTSGEDNLLITKKDLPLCQGRIIK